MESLAQDVANGEFYRWPSKKRKQWARLTKDCPSIGIEIETNVQLSHKVKCYLDNQGFVRTHCLSGTELTYLFHTPDISIFYQCVKKMVRMLGNQGISTLGGLHINVGTQTKNLYVIREKERITNYMSIRSARDISNVPMFRVEFKDGAPFITHQQLIIQLVTRLEFVHNIIHKKAVVGQQ